MRIIRKNKNKWFILAAVLVAVLAGWLAVSAYLKSWPFESQRQINTENTSVNYDAPTEDQIEEGSQTKQEIIENSKPNEYTPTESTAGVSITVAENNEGTFVVRTLIQAVTTGTCTLQMTGPGSATYSETVNVQPMANTSTCQGFNIPMDKLMSGEWNIDLTFTNADGSSSATKEVTI